MKDIVRPGLSLRQRLLYVIAPPGWSHDGSRQSSHDIKRAAGVLDGPANVTSPAE
jgi:hypothetical protein